MDRTFAQPCTPHLLSFTIICDGFEYQSRKLDLEGDVHEMGGKEVSRQIAAEIAHQSTDQID